MNHVTGLFQFKMVCFHPNFSQTLQCLINQTTSQMYLFRDHLTITNNISLSNNFFLREKSAWKYTISRFSTCVDTGKNSEKHTLLRQSSVSFQEFFPVCMHVENFEMVQDCTLLTLTFLLRNIVRQANIVCFH